MKKGWLLLGVLILALAAGAVLLGARSRNLPQVEIWLGQPVERVVGHEWPRYKENGQRFDVSWIDKPVEVKLHLPDGREIVTPSKGTWIGVDRDVMADYAKDQDPVDHVSVLPLLEAVPPREVASHVAAIAKLLAVQSSPQGKDEPSASDSTCPSLGWRVDLGGKASAILKTKTHEGPTTKGCYLVLDFWWEPESSAP